ncbi:hypothetical protein J1G34_15035, partial [Pseudomonas sp. Wu6]|nr:hypothetical protein [Pseudomonas sp. Wu6]
HGFKPAFGQRGLTGRLRSKADQDQERLASHRGYGWALLSCVGTCKLQVKGAFACSLQLAA